jgi:thymidylate synthase (FAD)
MNPHTSPLCLIEKAGRTCYKSGDIVTNETSKEFTRMILKRGHESVIEHSAMTVKFICDRGVSHEIVRHRLCAFSQESTRYCNYKGEVTFVIPPWCEWLPGEYKDYPHINDVCISECGIEWFKLIQASELCYIHLLENGWSPQQAHSVLPNSLKTEIIVTANLREWRHIFRLRCQKAAHPQMREVMIPLLEECKKTIPVIFDDIEVN